MTSKKEEILKSIQEDIQKNKLNKIYGTSIDESMSHQQSKEIRNKINKLIYELENELNLTINEEISKENLKEYYEKTKKKYDWDEFDFDINYQNNIFTLLKHPFEEQIAIPEFLKQYIILEEGMKIRFNGLNQQKENCEYNISQYEDQINKHLKSNIKNISLGISVFEVLELEDLNGEYFVKLYCDKSNEQISKYSKNSINRIIWNENFKFDLKERNQILHLELFEKNIAMSKLIGKIDFILENLDKDQQRVEQLFDLKDPNDERITIGKIRIKLHYVYDVIQYFQALLNKAKNELKKTNRIIDTLSKYNKYYFKPFGVIMSGGIDDLINLDNNENNMFDDNIENLDFGGVRKSVIHNPLNDSQRYTYTNNNNINLHDKKNISPNFRTGNTSKENLNDLNFEKGDWNKCSLISIISSLGLSCFNNILDRNDLINFMGCFALLLLFFFNGHYDKSYLKYALYYFLISEVLDIFWLFVHFGTYSISDGYLSIYKELIYGFSFINFFIKGFICYCLFKIKSNNKENNNALL